MLLAEGRNEPMIPAPDLFRVLHQVVNVGLAATNEAGHGSNSVHVPLLSPNRRDLGLGLHPCMADAPFIPARLFPAPVEGRSTEHQTYLECPKQLALFPLFRACALEHHIDYGSAGTWL